MNRLCLVVTYLAASKDNSIESEEIAPYVDGLLTLFEQTSVQIEELEVILDRKK